MDEDSEFDKAIAEFAMAYADQTERDWRVFVDTIKAGGIGFEQARSGGGSIPIQLVDTQRRS
jgi:hypothetical protein